MIAGVCAVESRAENVRHMEALIGPYVRRFDVYWDYERRGHWWNYTRTLRETLAQAGRDEPALVLTDDVTTVPDWYERWLRLQAQVQRQVYVLFCRQRHIFKPENIARGYTVGTPKRGFYDQATIFVNLPHLVDDALAWFAGPGQDHPRVRNRRKHVDVVIQEYLTEFGIEWVNATPTLFDHQPLKSEMGHAVGGSPCYVGRL